MHGTATEWTTTDKQRRDVDTRCDGFLMSRLCGKGTHGDIIRLDRDLEWSLEPDKKLYEETPFPTAEERLAAQQQMQAMLEKIKSCPQTQPKQQVDTSKCQLSPPKVEVKKTDEQATIAGHETHKSTVALTQSCTDKQTGDVCEIAYNFDVWLTADDVPGLSERQAFTKAHMHKLGLDQQDSALRGQVQKMLAQYTDQIKELSSKAQDLKGLPLKTSFRMTMGGEHCGQVAKMKESADSGGGNTVADAGAAGANAAAGTATGAAVNTATGAAGRSFGGSIGGAIASSGVGAFGNKMVGGLFNKKKSDSAGDASKAAPATAGGAPSVQMVEFTVETTVIDTAAIPTNQFEIPAGWKLFTPTPGKQKSNEFTCPAAGD
jgi:hypothetical protein